MMIAHDPSPTGAPPLEAATAPLNLCLRWSSVNLTAGPDAYLLPPSFEALRATTRHLCWG